MANRNLVIRAADLDAMDLALAKAHTTLLERTREAMAESRSLTAGWDERSASRIAEVAHARRLSTAHTELVSRLAQLRTDLAAVREAARQCEIRNVAILD